MTQSPDHRDDIKHQRGYNEMIKS